MLKPLPCSKPCIDLVYVVVVLLVGGAVAVMSRRAGLRLAETTPAVGRICIPYVVLRSSKFLSTAFPSYVNIK